MTTTTKDVSELLREVVALRSGLEQAEADLEPHLLALIPHVRRVREADAELEAKITEAYRVAFGYEGQERAARLHAIHAVISVHPRLRYAAESGGCADYIGSRLARLKAAGRINHEE